MAGDSGISMQEEAKRLLAEHRERTKELREAMEVHTYVYFLSLFVVSFVVLDCIDVDMPTIGVGLSLVSAAQNVIGFLPCITARPNTSQMETSYIVLFIIQFSVVERSVSLAAA